MADYNGTSFNMSTSVSSGAVSGASVNSITQVSVYTTQQSLKWVFNPFVGKLEYATKPYPLI